MGKEHDFTDEKWNHPTYQRVIPSYTNQLKSREHGGEIEKTENSLVEPTCSGITKKPLFRPLENSIPIVLEVGLSRHHHDLIDQFSENKTVPRPVQPMREKLEH
jgi:hypothetical protein